MTEEKFDNEKEIRRFLLGEMTERERTAFEERFIAEDAGLFEEIAVVEDELIESYVRKTLSGNEEKKFEQNFLTTETRRGRVGFTREMLAELAAEKEPGAEKSATAAKETSVWAALAGLFKTPKLIFAAAFVMLALIFGFWLLVFRNPEKSDEIVRQTTPTPQKNDENQNVAVNRLVDSANKGEINKSLPNTNIENLNKNTENSNKNRPPEVVPKNVIATIVLFAGTVRAEGKMRELNLTKETKGATFELNLENQDYQIYRAEIVDAEGRVIYRSGKINARRGKVNTLFPTEKLKKGDYFVKVYGFNPAGAEESAADFQFRVNQK